MLSPERLVLGEAESGQVENLAKSLAISEVLATLLVQRGQQEPEQARRFLEADESLFHDPFLMRDMEPAVELLLAARQAGHPVLVHGDYDVDGVCATTLLTEGLTDLGFTVQPHVPDRTTEGYGVSVAAVERAAAAGAKLLLSADCGSSSHRAIERAHELGMQVIISDHHRLPEVLPRPEAFLNPQLPDCGYPFKGLCGTGVAYKILQALHRRSGWPEPISFLDLVAVATIADVVPLLDENRALTRVGLARLGQWDRPGFRALAEVAGVAEQEQVGSWTVAFSLAPRINAAGRLENATLALELMLSRDAKFCRERARLLDELNKKRQDVEREIRESIEAHLAEHPEKLEKSVIVEAGEGWNPGVVGITAARLVEAHARPAFVLSILGDTAKGSARSPETVDLFAAMTACADLFEKFGGHARAGGFTLPADRVDELRERLDVAVRELRQDVVVPVRVDLELPLASANLSLARELTKLEPIGEANPRPLFLSHRVRLDELQAIGKSKDHLRWHACQGDVRVKAIGFRQAELLSELKPGALAYDLLYHLEEDNWQGGARPSLVVESILSPDPRVVAVLERRWQPSAPDQTPEIFDLRSVLDRKTYIARLLEAGGEGVLLLVAGEEQVEATRKFLSHDLVFTQHCLPESALARDVVLLGPPADGGLFAHPVLLQAERLHILFGEKELEREARRHDALWLDRVRMEAIYRALVQVLRPQPLPEARLPELTRFLPPQARRPETVQAALEVLEELGVVFWEADPSQGRTLRLGSGSGQKLEDSSRYRELSRRGQEFQRLRRVFAGGRLSRTRLFQVS